MIDKIQYFVYLCLPESLLVERRVCVGGERGGLGDGCVGEREGMGVPTGDGARLSLHNIPFYDETFIVPCWPLFSTFSSLSETTWPVEAKSLI